MKSYLRGAFSEPRSDVSIMLLAGPSLETVEEDSMGNLDGGLRMG